MHSTAPAAFLAALLSVSAAMPADAADITLEQAGALQSQLQGWLGGILGPDASSPGPTIRVRPEGDHYRVELPFGAGQPSPMALSASAQPADGGRWTFEGPELPSPAGFTLNMPVPARTGNAPGSTAPVDYTITIGSQESRGSFDPGFATASTLATSSRDVQIRAQSAMADQLTKIERSSGTSMIRPSGAGRVDFTADGTIEGYTSVSRSQDGPAIELAAQQVRATSGITALSRDRAAAMLPALVRVAGGFLAGMPKPGSNAPARRPSVDPQLLRTIVESLQDLASEFTSDETFDGAALRFGTSSGAASQFRIGLEAKSDGGLLQAHMSLGLDGLILSEPGLGAIADLLPRKVALRPVLTGLHTDEVLQWLGTASEASKGTRPPGFATLFRRAGVSAGLESFAVDLGGASFTGMGTLTTTSPDDLTGQAQIIAANFDDLLARVNATPESAHLLPLLIFAKGISQTVEGRLVWNLAYRDNKLSVNGTDLPAMMGRGPGPDSR